MITSRLLELWQLVTNDAVTLTAACVLALAVLGLLLLACWPSSTPTRAATGRSATARALVAAGRPMPEVARQTGLSRDAIGLLSGSHRAQRQNPPSAAPPAWRFGLRGER
jgi:hypothetical protein